MVSPGGPIQNLKATNEFVKHDSKRIQNGLFKVLQYEYEPTTFSETIIIRGTITQCCVYDINDYIACILM